MGDGKIIKGIVVSDLHCGHLTGLTPPRYMSDDTRITQEPLWCWYEDTIKKIGLVDFVVVNGDAVDGEGKKDTLGHLTTNTLKQAEIAFECLRIIQTKSFYMTYGTPYHVSGSYQYEDVVAEKLKAKKITDVLRLQCGMTKFNFRHVVGRSDTAYGQGTPILKEIIRDMVSSLVNEHETADYFVRSHVHYVCEAGIGRKKCRTTGALQVPESVYGHKLRPMFYEIGFLELQILPDGNIHEIDHIMPLKIITNYKYEEVIS